MDKHFSRSVDEPIREDMSWDERWMGYDKGLITCWERGREKREKNPDLVERARKGELVILAWKGGVEKKTKQKKQKYGALQYLSTWQGLRGDDLDININEEKKLICSKTGKSVIFTNDSSKYLEP